LSTLTKVFVVLQLVVSLVVAALVVVAVGKLPNYKEQVQSANLGWAAAEAQVNNLRAQLNAATTGNTEAIKDLQGKMSTLTASNQAKDATIAQLKIEKDAAEARATQSGNTVQVLTASVNSLKDQLAAKDGELNKVRPEITALIQRNAELERANNELRTQNDFASRAIKKLQEELVAANEKASTAAPAKAETTGAVAALAAGNQSNVQINGKITGVQNVAGKTYISLPLGTRDGIKTGTQFAIYRGTGYIGDATVTRVAPDQSVAVVGIVKEGQTVQNGDMVISGVGQ